MSYYVPANVATTVRQGDLHVEELTLTDGGSPVNIAALYDEIVCEVRKGVRSDTDLIKRIALSGGGITITSTNQLNLNLTTTAAAGTYYADVRFRITGTQNWVTLITLTITLRDSTTRID